MAKELHPDMQKKGQSTGERFKRVTSAYHVIGNEYNRQQYDEMRDIVVGEARRTSASWQPEAKTWNYGGGGNKTEQEKHHFYGSTFQERQNKHQEAWK